MSDTKTRAKKLFDMGAHLGHRKSRLHPRARKYVYDIIDGVSVIDLEQTIEQIDTAKGILANQAQVGDNKVLLVATKKSISQVAQSLANDAGMHFITTKWLPGLLTNFDTIAKNTKKLIELKRQRDAGEWGKFVKHEQVQLDRTVKKLERLYGGVISMHGLPHIMIVIDTKKEKNAIKEASLYDIPVIAIVDTNCNPDEVGHPIVINDDSPETVISVLTEIIGEYKKNTQQITKPVANQEAEKSLKSTIKKAKSEAIDHVSHTEAKPDETLSELAEQKKEKTQKIKKVRKTAKKKTE
jgi:small subunit ribosomal protein S2